jgi:Big-like domain-containing protein/cadherin-like protein/VCBS repeat protein
MAVTATQTTVLFNDVDGDGVIDPADVINPVPTTGDTVRTTVVITNASGPDATGVFFVENGDGHLNGMTLVNQTGNDINVSPIAFNDTYNNAVGNTLFVVGTVAGATGPQANVAGNVLANDAEFFSDTFQISSFQATSVNGGTVVMETTGVNAGSFSYITAAGFSGASDSFTYTVTDAGLDGNFATTADNLTSTATVTINLSGQVWYVDANAGAGGTGTSTNPFNTLASVSGGADADDAGDIIFVHDGTYSTGVTLENSQTLWGEGSALIVNGFTLQAAGADAIIDPGNAVGVTLATHNTLKGFTVEDTTTDILGADVGNLTISNVDLTNSGRLVNLTTGGSGGSVSATFDTAVSTGTASNTAGATLSNLAGSITFNNAAISGTNGTGVGFDVIGGTANIDYNGSITETNNARTISVVNKTGGTTSFDGAVSSTGSSDGIFLNNNTGATNSFTGTLTLTTSASGTAGFTATGGGTVTATGSGSTISSGSGIGLNVVNTNIGTNDLTFQSISTNGASSGIVLNNTGTSASFGGLIVTGDNSASDNGSGGVIQSSTGVGISLTSTRDVSLDQMNITSSGDDGIRGQGVTNFTLDKSNLTNNGNAAAENGIQFGEATGSVAGAFGTVSITNTDVTGSAGNNVHIRNTSGTLDNLTVTNSTFNNLNDTTGANSFLFEATDTAVVTEAFITGSTFSNNSPQRALEVQAHNTATISDFVVSGNTFTGNGIHASFTQDTSSNLEFYLVNNTITTPNTADNVLQAVNVFSSSTSTGGTIVGTIQGNTIATNGENIGGIQVVIQGRTDATLLIDDNDVTGTAGTRGISVAFRGPTSAVGPVVTNDVTITNNTVDNVTGHSGTLGVDFFPLAAISVEADNQSGNDAFAPIVRADIAGNTVPSGGAFDLTSAYLQYYEYDAVNGHGVGQLVDRAPASADADAQLAGANTGSTDTFGISLIAGPINVPPPVPTPLLAASGGVDAAGPDASGAGDYTSPPAAVGDSTARPAPALGAVEHSLTQAQLDAIVSAAVARWEASGLTAEQNAYLQNVTFNVADMSGMYLGATNPGLITIDSDAAGYGWYVDANPADDAEFANGSGTRLTTDAGGTPAGHIDLLTTVMHEMGHQLGLGDSYSLNDRDGLMYGYLVTGERRLPGEHQADGAELGSVAHEEFLVGPISIGTLPAGQTVTIQWDATIDAQSNALIANLSNQGTVTGNQPGAFSVNTDGDGNSGNGTQATLTVLDSLSLGNLVFWDKDANGLFDGADVGVNGVTLSLFVDVGNDNNPDGAVPIATTTTAGGGLYSFTGIAPGHYIVRVDVGNFTGPAGALKFLQTSPVTSPEPIDPDSSPNPPADVNNDDNGFRNSLGNAAFTNAITLTYNNEPTGFVSGNDTNNTLDLGFTNIAPVLDDNATPTLTAINEDAGAPGVGSGTLVSQLVDLTPPVGGGIDNVTDADSTQTGLALTAVDNTNGTWKYSLNGGTSWTNVPAVSDDNALLLAADGDTRLYFQPNANFFGTSSITFRAWDQSDGSTEGSTADPSPGGDSTAFSAVFDTAGITINSVNDQPLFAALDGTPTYTENGAAVVLDANATVSDVELDAANNYDGATLTLVRSTGTNPDDVFNDGSGTLTFGATDVSLTGTGQVGTYTHVNGTLVITFDSNATSAAVDSVLQQLTYRNTSDNPTTPSVTINYTFSDGNAGAQGSTFTPGTANGSVVVNITASNDAPTLDLDGDDSSTATGADYKGLYIPAGPAVPVADGDTAIGDLDDTNMESATITITNAQLNDQLTFSGAPPAGIIVGGSGTTILTLTGTSSKANYETALEQVRFSNTTPAPGVVTRLIDIKVNDGTNDSNTAQAQIQVNNPPTAPADTDAATADAVTEGAAAGTYVGIDANSTDPELTTVTYSFAPAGDAGGRFDIDSTSGVVSVSAAGATTIDFESSGGSYAITVRATDGDGAFSDAPFTVTVNNVAPTQPADGDGGANTVVEGAPNGTTVGVDADSTDVNGGTVTYAITAGNADGAFAIGLNSGIVTIADATKIDFETATSRLITVQATDGTTPSATQDFLIAVTDAPPSVPTDGDGGADTVSEGAANGATVGIDADSTDVNSGTVTFSLFDDAGGRFTIDPTTGVVTVANAALLNFENATSHGITVRASDPSGAFSDQGFTIAVTNVAPVATGDGYSVAEDQSLSVPATGVLGNDSDVHGGAITAVLDVGPANAASFALASDGSFTYQAIADYNGPDSFTYHPFDGTAAGNTVTVNLTVTEVNDAPTATDDGLVATFAEDSGANAIPFTDLTTNDSKGPANEVGQTLTVSAVNNAVGGSVAIVAGHVEFTPTADFNGAASFDYTTTDNGTTNGVADPKSDDGHVTFTVTEVNDAPTAVDDTLSAVAEDSGTRTITFADLTGNDSKGPANESGQSLTVTAVNNAIGGSVAIVAGHVEFTPAANFFGTASFDYTVQDNGTTNGVADFKTDVGNASFTVTAVNDAPALANVDSNAAYTEQAAAIALDTAPLIVPSDVDDSTLSSATIAITSGFVFGDLLEFPDFPIPASLGASYDPFTGILTINAVDTLADYQQVLRGITFSSNSDNPGPTRTITWTITDNGSPNLPSPSQTTNIAVTQINDAPLNTVPGHVNALKNHDRAITGLGVSDPDLGFNNITVTLHVDHGTLHIRDDVAGGLDAGDITGNDTATVTLQADIASVNETLQITNGAVYHPNAGFIGDDTLTMTSNDGGNTGLGGVGLDTDTVGITVRAGAQPGDFSGDGKSDIYWRHTNGISNVFIMDGATVVGGSNLTAQVDNVWKFQDKNDFNGDGHADILWRHDNGTSNVFLMDGAFVIGGSSLNVQVDNGWKFQKTGDFNGDGNADILWRHDNGTANVFFMQGATVLGGSNISAQVDNNWKCEGVADFDGDGKADILWRNLINGATNVYRMDGTTVLGGSNTSELLDNTWKVQDTPDVNGDGMADILWRNNDGTSKVWLMDGANVALDSDLTQQLDNAWKVKDTGDFDADGNVDILWRHDDGTVKLFFMDGPLVLNAADTTVFVDNNWHVL